MSDGSIHLEAIKAHVEEHFGPVSAVWHELVSDLLDLDVLVVEPHVDRPWWTLVTSGVSDHRMQLPPGVQGPPRAELVMLISVGHPMQPADWQDERCYWPIRQFELLARMPQERGTWLAPGHAVSASPPTPFAPGVPFCAMAVLEMLETGPRRLRVDDGEIAFLQVVPLYPEELRASRAGELDLADTFDDDVLRAVYNERPRLAVDAAEMERGLERGRLVAVLAVAFLAATVIANAVADVVDGAGMSWSRIALAVVVLGLTCARSQLARWCAVLLAVIAIVSATTELSAPEPSEWRKVAMMVSIPLWLLGGGMLAFGPGVGLWFATRGTAETRESRVP